MKTLWHVRRNFRDHGPFTGAQIRSLAGQGKLQFDDFLWSGRPEDGAPVHHYEGMDAMIAKGKARKVAVAHSKGTV